MDLTIFATSTGLLYGLAYFRTGKGPLELTVRGLLTIQATRLAIGDAVRVAMQVYRRRYQECIAEVIRAL